MPDSKAPKKKPTYEKKECPNCHKRIDIRGYNTHLRTHSREVARQVEDRGVQLDAYRRGYRDGWMDGKADRDRG